MAHRRFISAVGSGLLVLLLSAPAIAAGPYAYLTHYSLNKVSVVDTSVVDTALDPVVARVSVGSGPSGVAATSARVYVTNAGSNNVSVIDTVTNTLVGTIPVGSAPFGVAADASGQHIWVGNQGDNTLSHIDMATNQVTPAAVSLDATPFGIAVHPAGTSVFVTVNSGRLAVVDTTTLDVRYSAVLGSQPAGVAVSPDGTRAWVALKGTGALAVVDTATLGVSWLTVPAFANGVATDALGSRVFVGHNSFFSGGSVSVIDATIPARLSTITGVGWSLAGLSAHPSAAELWLADQSFPRVIVFDTVNLTFKREIMLDDPAISFGTFIAAPVAGGCDDSLQAAVEQALATVEGAMRRHIDASFVMPGGTPGEQVRSLGKGVNGLTRGHLTGVHQSLLRTPAPGDAAESQLCDEALGAAVAEMLSTVESALLSIDRNFRWSTQSSQGRLDHLAHAVATLERGRLQGLYWALHP